MRRIGEPAPYASRPAGQFLSRRRTKGGPQTLQKVMAADHRQSWVRERLSKLDGEQSGKAAKNHWSNVPQENVLRKIADEDLEEALSLMPKQDLPGLPCPEGPGPIFRRFEPGKGPAVRRRSAAAGAEPGPTGSGLADCSGRRSGRAARQEGERTEAGRRGRRHGGQVAALRPEPVHDGLDRPVGGRLRSGPGHGPVGEDRGQEPARPSGGRVGRGVG